LQKSYTRRLPHRKAAVSFGNDCLGLYKQRVGIVGTDAAINGQTSRDCAMQNTQPNNTHPLQHSAHGMGTLMVRFVGLLTVAVVLMTLIWSS
jgi:hypothetical protein